MKIAVIEDDIELNNLIAKILKNEGFEVDSFYDGESAKDLNGYDLYLIDLNLPKINGLDLLDIINGKKLVISANINPNIVAQTYEKGIEDYIKKPFVKEEFLHKIYKILPKEIKINNYILKPDENILIKGSEIIKLTPDESKFLKLFSNKDLATQTDIFNTIEKDGNAFYVFLSKLKKKTGLEFENIRGCGYKIKG
jgi:DNA-binding response OmpR family regulator